METHDKMPAVYVIMLIGILLILPSFVPVERQYGAADRPVSWVVQLNSFIIINGSSNVNTFGCGASGPFKSDPLYGYTAKDGKTVEMKGAISIPITEFDCRNRMLDKDLQKTLKAREFPEMTIRFVSMDRMPFADAKEDTLDGLVSIKLAGQCKQFKLRYIFTKTPSGFKLRGRRSFSFADFNLSPPKKAAGLIKVNDDFDVAFTLFLHNVN